MIFVDTGAWFACFVPLDPDHPRASEWYLANTRPLVTTEYVVAELLTLLKARGQYRIALDVGDDLSFEAMGRIEFVSPADLRDAWTVFQTFTDKQWSFNDCVSRVVMQRLGIREAFACDQHFRQFGTVTVMP